MFLHQVRSQESTAQDWKAEFYSTLTPAPQRWQGFLFSSYLLEISRRGRKVSSKDGNLPALSEGGPHIVSCHFSKTTLGCSQNYNQPMTAGFKHLLTAPKVRTFHFSSKQDGTTDPSSRVECLQPQFCRFRVNSFYKVDAMVFLLAINRSNTSHSQLDSRHNMRHTVSQQVRLHLAGCRTSLTFYLWKSLELGRRHS